MSKKIFIIEEDANISSGLESLLSLVGFEVRSTDTFHEEEIMDRIRFFNPDFIILEPDIRVADGFSILYNLKSDVEIVHKPVFVFTAMEHADAKKRAEGMGADYYFHKKDHNLVDFVAKIKKIIKNVLK